ncbi:hypothetical protein ACSTK8_24105 [Vibrio parahaemolyticus]
MQDSDDKICRICQEMGSNCKGHDCPKCGEELEDGCCECGYIAP